MSRARKPRASSPNCRRRCFPSELGRHRQIQRFPSTKRLVKRVCGHFADPRAWGGCRKPRTGGYRVHDRRRVPFDHFHLKPGFVPVEGCPSISQSLLFYCSVSSQLHSSASLTRCSTATTPDGSNRNGLRVLVTGERRLMLVSPCLLAQEILLISRPRPVPCSTYLCPDTLVCVDVPAQCPCPNVEDIRCTIPDAHDKSTSTVVCVRGAGCKDVDYHMNAWS